MATNNVVNGVVAKVGDAVADVSVVVDGQVKQTTSTLIAQSCGRKVIEVEINRELFGKPTKPVWIEKPKGETKLVFRDGEQPRFFSAFLPTSSDMLRYAEHPLPYTVIWKNKKNLEEVSTEKAIEAANRGQIQAWAYTQALIDAALTHTGVVLWRRAEEKVTEREWQASDIPQGASRLIFTAGPFLGHKFASEYPESPIALAGILNRNHARRFFVVEFPS